MTSFTRAMRRSALCSALLLVCSACATPSPSTTDAAATFDGFVLATPLRKPPVTLVDTSALPYQLRPRTAGRVLVIYVGYTHCRDVCPVAAGVLATVLRRLSAEARSKVTVAFATSDPARDTPARLRHWLGRYDPAIVGLTGSDNALTHLADAMHLPPITIRGGRANYSVEHGSDIYIYGLDNKARLALTTDDPVSSYLHDITLLTEGREPPKRSAADLALLGGQGRIGSASVITAFAHLTTTDTAVLTMTLASASPSGDQLTGVKIGNATMQMLKRGRQLDRIRIPPQTPVTVAGGLQIIVHGIADSVDAGTRRLAVQLTFARGGTGTIEIPISRQGGK